MTANTQKVLTKPIPIQRAQEMHLNMCLLNRSHGSEDTKCISNVLTKPFICSQGHKCILTCVGQILPCQRGHRTFVVQAPSMSARTQNVSQLNPFNTSKERNYLLTCDEQNHTMPASKCISRCIDQSSPKPAKTKCITTCFDKPILFQRYHKVYFYMF
jgi:hypothetical protein